MHPWMSEQMAKRHRQDVAHEATLRAQRDSDPAYPGHTVSPSWDDRLGRALIRTGLRLVREDHAAGSVLAHRI